MDSIIDTAMNASSPLMGTSHPFYPLEVEIAAYLANEMTMQVLLTIFVAMILTIVGGTKLWVDKVHPNLPGKEKAAIWWFVICTCFPVFCQLPNSSLSWQDPSPEPGASDKAIECRIGTARVQLENTS